LGKVKALHVETAIIYYARHESSRSYKRGRERQLSTGECVHYTSPTIRVTVRLTQTTSGKKLASHGSPLHPELVTDQEPRKMGILEASFPDRETYSFKSMKPS
jgi:hypothetical protein